MGYKKQIYESMKMPLGDVKAKPVNNFGLGGTGPKKRSLHDEFEPRQPPGVSARPPQDMGTIGYNKLETYRPESPLERGLEEGAQALRDMNFQGSLQDMLDFLYKIPRGLLSMPLMVPENVLRQQGLLGRPPEPRS